MDQPQKIWFVYLTDHHEGPFFPDEVAAMVAAGTVNLQTLGWKDGMAEWIAIEAIPELKTAIDNPPAPAAPAGEPEAAGSFSLAEMLARQQSGGAPAAEPAPEFSSGADALASFVGQANGVPAEEVPSSFANAGTPGANAAADMPAGHEEVWTLRVNAQVSGLFSLNQLRNMAAAGEVPPQAMLWHSGWTDFQPLSAVPELASAAQTKRFAGAGSGGFGGAPGGGGTNAGVPGIGRKPIFAPITAGANVGNDERTDTNISTAGTRTGITNAGVDKKAGLKNLFSGLGEKFGKKKASPAPASTGRTQTGIKKGASVKAASGAASGVKRVALLLFFFALLAGGGYGYLKYFSSPIPSTLDVLPDDLELLKETAKAPTGEGGRLHLASAKGSEENPVDDAAPKFYVGTNLPSGTAVHLNLVGKPGSLVNRVSFEKDYTANVGDNHLAVFERVEDDGKPLPMGEYAMKVSADGAVPVLMDRFMGGKKGAVYQDRLKKYKDKLQAEYDQEMQELRQTIDTLKMINADATKKIGDYKTHWGTAAKRGAITNDWKAFAAQSSSVLSQLEQKSNSRNAAGGPTTYQPRAFLDVGKVRVDLQRLIQTHSARLEGGGAAINTDELSATVAAGVASLEQTLAQALVKSPFDILGAKPAAPAPGEVPAADAPSAEGAAPAPTAAPAPAPNAPAEQ